MTRRTRLLATALADDARRRDDIQHRDSAQAQGGRIGGMQAGITVHGHWTIDVRNKDGALASHTELENALDPVDGPPLLAGFLDGEYVPALLVGDTWSGHAGVAVLHRDPRFNTYLLGRRADGAGDPRSKPVTLEYGPCSSTSCGRCRAMSTEDRPGA